MAKKPTPPAPVKTPPKKPATPATSADGGSATRLWQNRITQSGKDHDKWEKEFEVERLEEYYEGKQWKGLSEEERKKRYVINMVFATVETQLPSLLFSKPKVNCEARPEHEEDTASESANRATLIEQALQTYIDDPKLAFGMETTLALHDAYSRYSIIEVGYTADWIDNPNADKPVLKENDEPQMDVDGKTPLLQPKKILRTGTKERVFVKRIPAEDFRVGPGRNRLETNDWCAYREWHQVEDVKANKDYQNTEDLKPTGRLASDPEDRERSDADDEQRHAGMVLLWKIFDIRRKVKHVMADGHAKMLQENKPFNFLPFASLKFFERRNAWLPLPPIYNWLSPQDEINESREQQKIHRRRASRRYMREPSVKSEEFAKLESGEDMVCIEVPKVDPPPIAPIPDAPLDAQNWTELAASKDDFNQIAGVGGEARGVPDEKTATQANIINVREQVRESRARTQVATWLADIARLMLLTIRAHVTAPFMVKRTVDPFAMNAARLEEAAKGWQEIEAEDIDELDVDITIDVASLSPVSEDAQRQEWNQALTIVANPQLQPILMEPDPVAPQEPSPIFRKTLTLNGVKSDQEIRTMWRIGQAMMAKAMAAAAAQAQAEQRLEPMKLSMAAKPEDLHDPIAGPILMAIILREEGMKQAIEANKPPVAPLNEAADAPGAGAPPAAPGPTTGTPATAGAGA
jgi:hypothetical protein